MNGSRVEATATSSLRVPVERIEQGRCRLDRDAAHYVARVRRVAAGQTVTVFDPEARTEAEATVLALGPRGEVVLDVGAPRTSTRLPERAITLLQGLGKGDKLDAVVRDATELAATCVHAVSCARSVPVGGSAAKLERWRRIAVEAARQCGRGDVPDVWGPTPFDEAIERTSAATRLVLCPDRAQGFGRALASKTPEQARSVALLVGPEGGLSPEEIAMATARGYEPVTLGPFVLRTETAAAAALGAIHALAPLLDGLASLGPSPMDASGEPRAGVAP